MHQQWARDAIGPSEIAVRSRVTLGVRAGRV